MSKRKKITEETGITFTRYDQLSYYDNDEPEVVLYIDEKPVGEIKVWQDSEMQGREYICLNYEIVYLDRLIRRYTVDDTGEIPWDLGTK